MRSFRRSQSEAEKEQFPKGAATNKRSLPLDFLRGEGLLRSNSMDRTNQREEDEGGGGCGDESR